jgi:predicted nucleic acid-binding protein
VVIADTSVWIEYFKGGEESVRAALRVLIRAQQAVLVGVVLAELLQGCRSPKEAETILSHLAGLRFLETRFST